MYIPLKIPDEPLEVFPKDTPLSSFRRLSNNFSFQWSNLLLRLNFFLSIFSSDCSTIGKTGEQSQPILGEYFH
ncbi:hypothetical protein HYO65_gp064 [Tenacibaculum phage PTm1]|uniref:Uncharacterized protein n=2 Tax=Shirahamavirus PTm1 TaxID=2846435 RepID=A0A5S9HX58_9CAUD|nr:hypothetical protein HYO65_gp064 [Tenacibaculum phage PTm1]BBI90456.1 hypothetical protein [Tenacibaculum phage PTm1]BBI90764.1 hypothetical protein [Tenacibaculum phage PTm5]